MSIVLIVFITIFSSGNIWFFIVVVCGTKMIPYNQNTVDRAFNLMTVTQKIQNTKCLLISTDKLLS